MIVVSFYSEEDALILDVKGHAGQDEPGKDIVCSASSILAYTVAQIVIDMYKEDMLTEEPVIVMESGNAEIRCIPKAEAHDDLLHTFYVAETGYRLLAHNFPEYVVLDKTVETDIVCSHKRIVH